MAENEKWRKAHNAIKYMYEELYKLDKNSGFKWPTRKNDLELYSRHLRSIVEDALHIADAVTYKGHDLKLKKETKSTTTNNEE